jgi:septal ring factor EnvC (AmiA/AmiB activator)
MLLSVVASLAAIAAVATFFLSDDIGPEVRVSLQYIGASQQRTTTGIEAINASLAAEQRDLKMLSDQFVMLAARLGTRQGDAQQILRNNTELAQRLKATQAQLTENQAQLAENNASVVEQLKALTQMVRDNAGTAEELKASQLEMADAIAKVSENSVRLQVPLPLSRPLATSKRWPLAPRPAKMQLQRGTSPP